MPDIKFKLLIIVICISLFLMMGVLPGVSADTDLYFDWKVIHVTFYPTAFEPSYQSCAVQATLPAVCR